MRTHDVTHDVTLSLKLPYCMQVGTGSEEILLKPDRLRPYTGRNGTCLWKVIEVVDGVKRLSR